MMSRQWKATLVALSVMCLAIVVAASQPMAAQGAGAPAAQTIGLSQAIPVDPLITVNTLPNGLRYYVRNNKKPEKRAELRLVVKAGSVLEDDDQQGLAHFVEHMAFNGTEHFPKAQVIDFMQGLGMKFGAHVNAYTSFDETVYQLQVPTDRPEALDKAMLILEDWAHGVTFDPVEIDKERGVVMEEWRMRRGAGARTMEKEFPVLLKGSRYAERIPIGKPEILQSFKPDRLTQFYKDWYRPNLMAVVAVGDFDSASVATLIKNHFTGLTNPPSPRKRVIYDVPDHSSAVFSITSDKETTNTSVEIDTMLPAREQGTVGVYRDHIVDNLFSSMLSARFSEMAQKPDAPFLAAFAGRSIFLARTKEQASLGALVKDDGIEKGLEALLAEAERVTRYGFTASELAREKQDTLKQYERLVTEKDSRQSASRAEEYIRNFLEQESLPTIEYELALQQRFLNDIKLDEVNKVAKAWFPDRNRNVVVNAPERAGLTLPDQTKLAAVIKAAPGKDLKPYVDSTSTSALLESPPAAGTITKTSVKDAQGITEFELSNGAKVVLKPTTYREDEIVMRATRWGGTSLASDADFIAASSASTVVGAGGVGQLSNTDLRKALTGKAASVRASIGELDETVSGSSSKQDLETMFQLLYLTFTEPRPDPTVVGVLSSQLKTLIANQSVSPDYAFIDTVNSTLTQNHPRRRAATVESIDQWNLDKSMAFYKERFGDASGFTFVFVGSFDVPTIKPLVEKYVASLPSTHHQETWKDIGVRYPTGNIVKRVEKGIEPKSQTAIVFTGPFEYDQTHRVAIRAMSQVLQSRLLETIREELGGTYSITAGQSYSKVPTPTYSVTIQFGSDPTRTESLVKRVFEEIERLKTSGPTPQQVTDVKLSLQRDFETSMKTNGYLLSQISAKYQYGEDVAGVWEVPQYYDKIDAAMIQQAAKTYLRTEDCVNVMLFPEKKGQK